MPKACITYGAYESHTPAASSMMAQDLLEEAGYEVDMVTSLDVYEDKKYLDSIDLMVQCWTMATIEENEEKHQLKTLITAVLDGLGFVGWHGGIIDSFRTQSEYEWFTGANFVTHLGGIIDYDVDIVEEKKDDPIVAGLSGFHLKTEQYYCNVDPGIIQGKSGEVLCTTTIHNDLMDWVDGVVMPAAYKRSWGEGKVFVVTWGHSWEDFEQAPEAKEILKRGMLWATRSA
jgi:hypothetical protein